MTAMKRNFDEWYEFLGAAELGKRIGVSSDLLRRVRKRQRGASPGLLRRMSEEFGDAFDVATSLARCVKGGPE